MIKKYALVLFVLLTSCDLIDYHPYDGRITYKEDKDKVSGKIKELVKKGEYPDNLWKK